MKQSSNIMVGLAGEHAVSSELCRMGILALVTPKNNPLFDIVATDPKGKRNVSIQVKTMGVGNKQGWKLGKDITKPRNNPNLFVVLVNMNKDRTNDFYVWRYDDLANRVSGLYADYASTPKLDGGERKDPGFRWFDLKYFNDEDKAKLDNWDILGFGQ
ncbi:MAG: aspartate-ammonia lyase [Patescibacteria group bacterium]